MMEMWSFSELEENGRMATARRSTRRGRELFSEDVTAGWVKKREDYGDLIFYKFVEEMMMEKVLKGSNRAVAAAAVGRGSMTKSSGRGSGADKVVVQLSLQEGRSEAQQKAVHWGTVR